MQCLRWDHPFDLPGIVGVVPSLAASYALFTVFVGVAFYIADYNPCLENFGKP